MRSPSRRQQALASLSPELLRAVSDGRAKVTRSGRIVSAAPHSQTRDAGILAENPNRGKRRMPRMAQPIRLEQPYSPLTVSWPLTDRAGRRNPRMGRAGYTV